MLVGAGSTATRGVVACVIAVIAVSPLARGQRKSFDPVTNTVTDSQPLMEGAKLLEERYGTAVTFEDPVWPRKVRLDLLNTDAAEMAAYMALGHTLSMPKGLVFLTRGLRSLRRSGRPRST